MRVTRFRLEWYPTEDFEGNEIGMPEVVIHGVSSYDDGSLTPKLLDSEFDHYINELKKQLEALRKQGNKRFEKERKKYERGG